MSKRLFILLLFVGIFSFDLAFAANVVPAGASAENKTPAAVDAKTSDALVTIGAWKMTKEDFQAKLKALKQAMPEYDLSNKQQNRQVLDRLIEQRLFVAEAERQGMDKNKDLQLAVEEFRNTLLVQQLAAKVTEGIESTDAEIQDFYDKNAKLFVKDGEWTVREIMVSEEAAAKQIAAEIAQGGDFAQIAQQKSKGKTAAQGGALGVLKEPKDFSFPEMAKAILAMNVGEVSPVVMGPEGFYLFKLEAKKGGEPMKLDEIKKDLKAELDYGKKEQAVVKYLEGLRNNAAIQINEKLLEE